MRKNRKYSRNIFRKLVLFTVVTSILPITFLCIILIEKINAMSEQEIMESYRQLSYQYIGNIEEKIEQYERSIFFISGNTKIVEALQDETGGIYKRGDIISEEVFKSLLLEGQTEMRNCIVYSMVEDNPVYGTCATMIGAGKRESWYSYYNGVAGSWFYHPVFHDEDKSVASIIQNIQRIDTDRFGRDVLGIVKLDINMNKLFEPADTENTHFEIVVYDKDNRIWYSTTKESRDYFEGLDHTRFAPGTGGVVTKSGQRLVFQTQMQKSGLNVMLLFSQNELALKQKEIQDMLFPIIFIVMGTVTISAYWFARKFSDRINMLVHKFKQTEMGNLDTQEPIPGKDEIAVLDGQFNEMLSKLNRLIQKNYVQELEKKETELKNLELQINPHFLYNTLETISSISAVQHVFVVCDICQRLGEIFRYSLGKNYGDFVPVKQELHHVENYIFIQKLRYGNKFEVFYNIAPNVEECSIPRFILQPIVENAIQHGLEPMTGSGTLEITVEQSGTVLEIRIEDDGIGMDEMKKEELIQYINRNEQKEEQKKSIGVRNVNRRIKLLYGEEYGIRIESNSYRGSSFILRIPLSEDKTQ